MKFLTSQILGYLHIHTQKSNARILWRFTLLLVSTFLLYSIIFHVLMEYEDRDYSWMTGIYWTLTVMSTLGFGDITFVSDLGRIFSVIVLLSGIIILLIMMPFMFIQFFYAPWLEEQNKNRAPRQVNDMLSNHVIFTKADQVTYFLVEKMKQYGIPYVILVADLQQTLSLGEMGYQVVLGELDDPETYNRLRVRNAALVVVMNDDITSTNIVFTIREVSEQVIIVSNVDLEESLDILQLAGSNHTMQFTKLLGESLARRVLGVSTKANIIGCLDQLLFAEVPAMQTPLQGKTLTESRLHELAGVNVVGIWEQGRFFLPRPNSLIGSSTVLLLVGSEEQLDCYEHFVKSQSQKNVQRGPVLVLGGGRVGRYVANNLKSRGIDYCVVEKENKATIKDQNTIIGSAANIEILEKAGIKVTPSIIVTTHDDDLNIYLTIYCRRLRPDVQIISRASLDRNIITLHRAGANLVMSYTSLCATTIMNLLKPGNFLVLTEGLNVFRSVLHKSLINKPLFELGIREKTGCSIVAIKRGEATTINPVSSFIVEENDELVLIGTALEEKHFLEQYFTA